MRASGVPLTGPQSQRGQVLLKAETVIASHRDCQMRCPQVTMRLDEVVDAHARRSG